MSTDARAIALESWAAGQLGWRDWSFELVSADASFRRYFRLRRGQDSAVVMDAPPPESIGAFLDVAGRLRRAGLHAPEIMAFDTKQGLVLLEDLGDTPFHLVLNADNAAALFDDALDALVTLQHSVETTGLPAYHPALLLRELALFTDWFLARHWQVEPTDEELDAWDVLCATLIRWALDQPQRFCHRDYMPRNLMLAKPNPGIIDFQDAVVGPISYDPVCLFRDAFLSWPPERVDAWLEDYRQRALMAGLPVPDSPRLWQKTCDLMGVQRHLKVIGIFARLCYRDGKPQYLADQSRFFSYLDRAIARNPELAPLRELLDDWRARAHTGD